MHILLNTFFNNRTLPELWEACHCQMLWEAIKKEDAIIISYEEVVSKISSEQMVHVFPEPLPALYMGIEPASKKVSTASLLHNKDVLRIEPLYIVSDDFSWMIVLTTENTLDGKQLCCWTERKTEGGNTGNG